MDTLRPPPVQVGEAKGEEDVGGVGDQTKIEEAPDPKETRRGEEGQQSEDQQETISGSSESETNPDPPPEVPAPETNEPTGAAPAKDTEEADDPTTAAADEILRFDVAVLEAASGTELSLLGNGYLAEEGQIVRFAASPSPESNTDLELTWAPAESKKLQSNEGGPTLEPQIAEGGLSLELELPQFSEPYVVTVSAHVQGRPDVTVETTLQVDADDDSPTSVELSGPDNADVGVPFELVGSAVDPEARSDLAWEWFQAPQGGAPEAHMTTNGPRASIVAADWHENYDLVLSLKVGDGTTHAQPVRKEVRVSVVTAAPMAAGEVRELFDLKSAPPFDPAWRLEDKILADRASFSTSADHGGIQFQSLHGHSLVPYDLPGGSWALSGSFKLVPTHNAPDPSRAVGFLFETFNGKPSGSCSNPGRTASGRLVSSRSSCSIPKRGGRCDPSSRRS